jgi:hypothetical protein
MSFFVNFCFFFHLFQRQFTSYLVVLSFGQGWKSIEPTLGIISDPNRRGWGSAP